MCIRIEAANRGSEPAPLHIIPHLWFRNTWSWTDPPAPTPVISEGQITREAIALVADDSGAERLKNLPFDYQLGKRYLYGEAGGQMLFTDNETNALRLYGIPSRYVYAKDGFHRAIVDREQGAVNPSRR